MGRNKEQIRFNPPENWPVDKDFTPPPDWRPDPRWGPIPPGWPLWVTYVSRPTWRRHIGLVVMALAFCGAISLFAIKAGALSGGLGGSAADVAGAGGSADASCIGKDYPDQQRAHDVCADPSGAVTMSGISVTASALRRDAHSNLCTDVTYLNQNDKPVRFNMLEWKLQSPDGEVHDQPFAASGGLGKGELASGASRTATICFDSIAGGGTYVSTFELSGLSDQRAVWLSTVS